MTFNSFQFLIFLPLVLGVYHLLPRKFRNIFLLAASYLFYGWWDWRFLSLIFISTLVDYYCGLKIHSSESENKKRQFLAFSLISNLGLLFSFKYLAWFHDSVFKLLSACGFNTSHEVLDILLPVGISFYTFQTLSYTIDIYRKTLQPTRSFFNFALYVSFFPQLVAGPIERASRLLPQIENIHRRTDKKMILDGLWLIALGFYKKIVIADQMSIIVRPQFDAPDNGFSMLLAMYAFSLQVYGDFSGYSDIARGVSRLFGVELMLNFKIPFFAKNIQEFWGRWHISLSEWVRDYLYIPLIRSRLLAGKTRLCIFLSMLIIGIWHGAAWKYVLFGVYHGGLLVLFESTRKVRKKIRKSLKGYWANLWALFSIVLTFHLVVIAFSIFGCKWVQHLPLMYETFLTNFTVTAYALFQLSKIIYFILPLFILQIYKERKKLQDPLTHWSPLLRFYAFSFLFIMIFFHGVVQGGYFIYFQF